MLTLSQQFKCRISHFTQHKGWVTRRQEESAKTISQIHKEIAREERAKRSSSTTNIRSISKDNIRRGLSSGDVRNLDKKPQVDNDGFVSVPSKSVHRSSSMTALQRSQSDGGWQKFSTRGSTAATNTKDHRPKLEDLIEAKPLYFSPEVCAEKAKNILKEYLVGGDTDDAVLSIHELVGVGDDGSIERGTKVVESCILSILEMKREEADKFLVVLMRCAREKKLESLSFVRGMNDPLEFLSDIVVDAPLATSILISVVAALVKEDIIPFDFLLSSPEYFRTDQNPAKFGAGVIKAICGEATELAEYVDVVAKLMKEEEKAEYSTVEEFVANA